MPLDPAIKSLIGQFRRSPQWDEHLDLQLLQRLWPALVGKQLAAATRITAIHGSTAVLDVPDRIWRRQLFRMKGDLLGRINEPWGTRRITEIAITYEDH
jgi:predicted nucleic acid-binding Zn ribbon protein